MTITKSYVFNFTYPVRCFRVPLRCFRLSQVENHWRKARTLISTDCVSYLGFFALIVQWFSKCKGHRPLVAKSFAKSAAWKIEKWKDNIKIDVSERSGAEGTTPSYSIDLGFYIRRGDVEISLVGNASYLYLPHLNISRYASCPYCRRGGGGGRLVLSPSWKIRRRYL
jgi:hypothetical protein